MVKCERNESNSKTNRLLHLPIIVIAARIPSSFPTVNQYHLASLFVLRPFYRAEAPRIHPKSITGAHQPSRKLHFPIFHFPAHSQLWVGGVARYFPIAIHHFNAHAQRKSNTTSKLEKLGKKKRAKKLKFSVLHVHMYVRVLQCLHNHRHHLYPSLATTSSDHREHVLNVFTRHPTLKRRLAPTYYIHSPRRSRCKRCRSISPGILAKNAMYWSLEKKQEKVQITQPIYGTNG